MPRSKGHPKTGGRKKGSLNGASIRKASERVEFIKVTVQRVLEEYSRIAFLDIGDAFEAAGGLKPIHEIPEDIRRAIAGIEVVNYEEDGDGKGAIGKLHKIKLLDKTKALQDLGKHLGMFIERIAGPDGGPVKSEHTIRYIDPPPPQSDVR